MDVREDEAVIDQMRGWLGDAIASTEADMADDYEDGQYTGERPDLADYEVTISLSLAKAILAALTPAPSLAAAKAEGMREAAALCRKRAISLYKTARNGEAMNTSAMMRAAEKYEQAAEVILAAADAPATEDDEAHPESRDYIRGWNDCMMKTHKLVPVNPPAPAQEDKP